MAIRIHSDPPDPTQVMVTVGHPHGDVEVSLDDWITNGPGPRDLVDVVSMRTRAGEPLPLSDLPLRYRNNFLARRLRALKLLSDPWQANG